jgi:hypothetical protein
MSTETIDEKPAAQVEHRWWLFTACVLVNLTNELSNAVTNLSLGPMRRDLGATSAGDANGRHPWQADARPLCSPAALQVTFMAGVACSCWAPSAWWGHPYSQRSRRRVKYSW